MNWFSLDNGAKMTPKRRALNLSVNFAVLLLLLLLLLLLFCIYFDDQLLETDKPTSGTPAI